MIGKHFLIWLLVILLTPLVTPYVLSPQSLSLYIRSDYNAAIAVLGEQNEINEQLIRFYKTNLQSIAAFANEFRDSHDDSDTYRNSGDHLGEKIADIPGSWTATVKLQAYSIALRMVILLNMAPWLLTPVLLACVAGNFERRLKFDTFSPPIPPIYNTATHALLILIGMIIFWLLSPIPLPLATIPLITVLGSVFLNIAIMHYPK